MRATTPKMGILVRPQLKNNGAFVGNTYVDTAGLGKIDFAFITGIMDVVVGSGGTSTPPFIEECDTYGGSYDPIDDAELAVVIPADGDDTIRVISLDLTKTHKRYMRINAPTAGNVTGANFCAIYLGYEQDVEKITAAGLNLAEFVEA